MPYEPTVADDQISKKARPEEEINMIVDRLYTMETESWKGGDQNKQFGQPRLPGGGKKMLPFIEGLDSRFKGKPLAGEELKAASDRLNTTKTTASPVRYKDIQTNFKQPIIPNLGTKCLPEIDGLDIRFRGAPQPTEQLQESTKRLHTTQTKATTARVDNPRILLYPERTTLMNNTARILAYQQNCEVAKQPSLARREKWYN